MRTSNLPFPNALVIPKGIGNIRTSDLIEKGPLLSFKNPGLAYYTPIGVAVLNNLRNLVRESHNSFGAMEVKIPNYMKRKVLNRGEKIQNTFAEKFVMLPEPMSDYMVLTTHEMELLDWLSKDCISHRSLPLRLFSSKEMLRPIEDPKGILKLREFETFLMLSIDMDKKGFENSLAKYSAMCEQLFNRLGIHYEKKVFKGTVRRGPHLDFDVEYFYRTLEGENVLEIENRKEKALSLAMGYKYNPLQSFARIVSPRNQLIEPVIGTYAMGLERLFYSVFDSCRDSKGFKLPEDIRPFDYSILVFGGDLNLHNKAESIYNNMSSEGRRVLFDDRQRCKRTHKINLSDYLGVPKKVIVSKLGVMEVKRD